MKIGTPLQCLYMLSVKKKFQTVLLSFFSFFQILFSQCPPILNSDNNSNAVYVLGHEYILGPSQSSFYPSSNGRHKFAYLIVKNNSFARFARAVFIFDISQTFSLFLRREMTRFAVVWTT